MALHFYSILHFYSATCIFIRQSQKLLRQTTKKETSKIYSSIEDRPEKSNDFSLVLPTLRAYKVLDKVAKSPSGNSARIYVPKSWVGKKVRVLLLEELGEFEE